MIKNILLSALLIFIVQANIFLQEETDYKSHEILKALNEYRASKGLTPVPFSRAMTTVAIAHVKDLAENNPDKGEKCNMHSWSISKKWSDCCYTPDHKKAQCMWNKPRELTDYIGNGYEIAASSSAGAEITIKNAMELWEKSWAHNDVMLNLSPWEVPWQAVGAAIYKGYAVVWFGNEKDLTKQ